MEVHININYYPPEIPGKYTYNKVINNMLHRKTRWNVIESLSQFYMKSTLGKDTNGNISIFNLIPLL